MAGRRPDRVVEGAYLRLLLLTGKRKSALANMQWQEIDDDWFWHAPQSDRKNKRLHGVPLPVRAQRILHPRQPRGFVFPGTMGAHRQWRVVTDQDHSGLWHGGFFFHGARHLAETKMAELKVAPHIRDMLFDHVPARVPAKATITTTTRMRCGRHSSYGPVISSGWCSRPRVCPCCEVDLLLF